MGNSNQPQALLHAGERYFKGAGQKFSAQVVSGDANISDHTYLYLYDAANLFHFIAAVYVAPYTTTKVVSFEDSILDDDHTYFVVWATCNCAKRKELAVSAHCDVSSNRSYQRQLADAREDEDRAKKRLIREEQEKAEQKRARQVAEAGDGKYYWTLSEEEREALRLHFNSIDTDMNGSISRSELKAFYDLRLGEKLFDSEIEEMFRESDVVVSDGRIDFTEFIDICVKAKAKTTSLKWQNLFRQFAQDLAAASKKARI